jgi:uncharacterized protein YqgC (DUF456 family)
MIVEAVSAWAGRAIGRSATAAIAAAITNAVGFFTEITLVALRVGPVQAEGAADELDYFSLVVHGCSLYKRAMSLQQALGG